MTISKNNSTSEKLYKNNSWVVSNKQFDRLLDMMNNPPEPRGALKRYYDNLDKAKKGI